MPVSSQEHLESREITLSNDNPRATLKYYIFDTHDHAVALTELKSAAPATFTVDGIALPVSSYRLKPEHIDEDASGGGTGHWVGEAEYMNAQGTQDTGTSVYNFDTGGGTTHVKQALFHLTDYGTNPPNHNGAIGVTKEGVEGIDIVIPNYQFTETHYINDANVNTATIAALTGCVNDGGFKGFNHGEVLFLGATGTKRASGLDWEINYRFAASPTLTNQTILSPLGNITVALKQGWDYLWVEYVDHFDINTGRLVRAAKAAHTEQVYLYKNLGLLGI